MSPDIIALQHENIVLRLLLEHATGQTSEALELYRQTAEAFHREALAHRQTAELYAGLAAYLERDTTGGTLQ